MVEVVVDDSALTIDQQPALVALGQRVAGYEIVGKIVVVIAYLNIGYHGLFF